MPELPEVETIARYLRQGTRGAPGLLGRRVAGIQLLWERSLASPGVTELAQRLPGQKLNSIDRRGKFLQLHFDLDTLLFHLRMSGDLFAEAGQPDSEGTESLEYNPAHIRSILVFEDGVRLVFADPRKFGRIWLVRDPQEITSDLGPEPLDPSFRVEDFHNRLSKYRRLLKPLLLDQTFLAGLGNIYADESMNLARLHPCQPAHLLSLTQAETLLDAIRTVLQQAIAHQGTSIDWVYRGGDFQNHMRVYQRTGKPCPNCGTPIERILLGQRATHFCPNCQRIVN
jgi:formamidopyrimidine-DNA glycosylase